MGIRFANIIPRLKPLKILPLESGTPAVGKIRRGDRVVALQYRGLGGSPEAIRRTVSKRIFRLGRDWDWHLYLTVERPSLREGKGKLRLTGRGMHTSLWLDEDPGEVNNLWDDPDSQGLKQDLMLKYIHAELGKEPMWMPRLATA